MQSRISEVEDQKQGDMTFAGGAETRRGIKSRHAQMIVIGGVIGTGFFVGMGQALATAAPAFLFVAYALISTLLYQVPNKLPYLADRENEYLVGPYYETRGHPARQT